MMTVKAAAERLKAEGASTAPFKREEAASMAAAQAVLEQWPEAPKMTAGPLLDHCGPPDEATPGRLFWYQKGPWSRMEITADQVAHNFPTPHIDYFTQFVLYPVPPERAGDLLAFDGSGILDRTTGEIGARCDHEAFNTLTPTWRWKSSKAGAPWTKQGL